ncbi:flavodoxin domain-containing protein [Lentzea sp. NBRC 102530]|uniref:flavodoxin domain-containing protein n=1 Tax=Lentzea sp. NBRC 102530 TaxID=3032201 RepID=UPI0024A210D8|nr:flavodoxin domain-containing protein [Lentzea sp. NBRC 102530]GLY49866.1 flavodoxin [Lentzea sp. NBRC 102530]
MAEILVAYATKMTGTKEIAEAIGARIRTASHEVTVLDAAEVQTVAPYKAVVLGSALYAGRWRPEAVKLLKRNADLLAKRPVWLFHSGPLGHEVAPQNAPKKVRELAARIGADEPKTFGGRISPQTAVGFLAKRMAQGPMAGDHRDWEAIDLWAYEIAQQLVAAR